MLGVPGSGDTAGQLPRSLAWQRLEGSQEPSVTPGCLCARLLLLLAVACRVCWGLCLGGDPEDLILFRKSLQSH